MILIAAQVEGIQSRKDKTIKLTFGTQELMPSMAGDLFSLNNQMVYLAIKVEPFNKGEKEIIESSKVDELDGIKSNSQRLRAVLYILWEQNNEGFKTFSEFYNARMELLINQIKNKLQP